MHQRECRGTAEVITPAGPVSPKRGIRIRTTTRGRNTIGNRKGVLNPRDWL